MSYMECIMFLIIYYQNLGLIINCIDYPLYKFGVDT